VSGAPRTLAPVVAGRGGTWNAGGDLVFAPSNNSPLRRVSAAGGSAVAVTTLGPQQVGHLAPFFLPDDRRFLFYAIGPPDTAGIYLGSLDESAPTRLTPADGNGVYLPAGPGPRLLREGGPTATAASREGRPGSTEALREGGWLLWVRAGALVAQRLDVAAAALTGDEVTLADDVVIDGARAAVSVVVSWASGIITKRPIPDGPSGDLFRGPGVGKLVPERKGSPRRGSPRTASDPSLEGLRLWPVPGFENFRTCYIPRADHVDVPRLLHARLRAFLRIAIAARSFDCVCSGHGRGGRGRRAAAHVRTSHHARHPRVGLLEAAKSIHPARHEGAGAAHGGQHALQGRRVAPLGPAMANPFLHGLMFNRTAARRSRRSRTGTLWRSSDLPPRFNRTVGVLVFLVEEAPEGGFTARALSTFHPPRTRAARCRGRRR